MKIAKLALPLLITMGAGCTTIPPATLVALPNLPNCFTSNYDRDLNLFTMKNATGNQLNQQCLLIVGSSGDAASASQLPAGRYRVSLANGGGGGAGGSLQPAAGSSGGGGGGGGAGALEQLAAIDMTEGLYRLTIGAGGQGGSACALAPVNFSGGVGWAGSPSNIVRIATGELVLGTAGAETYARPTRARNDRLGGKPDGHGGSGPGQISGGSGGLETKDGVKVSAEAGDSATFRSEGGSAGSDPMDKSRSGGGGGGGSTSRGEGGDGGGEIAAPKAATPLLGFIGSPVVGATSIAPTVAPTAVPAVTIPVKIARPVEVAPERGVLGSGGGGGEGSSFACAAGAQGGHGFVALRPI